MRGLGVKVYLREGSRTLRIFLGFLQVCRQITIFHLPIFATHFCQFRSKEIFLEHIRHEMAAQTEIRTQRSDRESLDRERTSDLQTLTQSLVTEREARIQEESADREKALLLRSIRRQLDNLVRLATRIGDYR